MFCSIVLQAARVWPRTPAAIIYLRKNKCFSPLHPFISVRKVPLPKFGLLAHGVYLVPPLPFLAKLRHCGTFKVFTPYLKDLGVFPAVSNKCCPGLWFRQARSLQASQHCASMDFPLQPLRQQRLPKRYSISFLNYKRRNAISQWKIIRYEDDRQKRGVLSSITVLKYQN